LMADKELIDMRNHARQERLFVLSASPSCSSTTSLLLRSRSAR
jgi:hypothetical protein